MHLIIEDRKSFLLKIITVIVGVIDIGLVGGNYVAIFTEEPFLGVVCIAFGLSLIHLVLQTIGFVSNSLVHKRLEILYHCVIAVLLNMTASVFFFSVIGLPCTGYCTSRLAQRYTGAVLGFVNAFFYALIAWNLMEIKIVSKPTGA